MRFLQRESAERGEADMLTSTMSQLPLIDLSSLSNMFYCLVLFFFLLSHSLLVCLIIHFLLSSLDYVLVICEASQSEGRSCHPRQLHSNPWYVCH